MSESKIEWTDRTLQLVRGCKEVSPGCRYCYAARTAYQLAGGHGVKRVPAYEGFTKDYFGRRMWSGKFELMVKNLTKPLRWKKSSHCFVCSMSDLFWDEVPEIYIRGFWMVMANRPDCEFQILTKRIDRMADMLSNYYFWRMNDELMEFCEHHKIPTENVDMKNARTWLGTSSEDADTWHGRRGRLKYLKEQTGLPVFVSFEPLLGSVAMTHSMNWRWLDLAIVGGESGYPNSRPMHPRWAREIRNVCEQQDVPFFFKQWGQWKFIEEFHKDYQMKSGDKILGSHASVDNQMVAPVIMRKVRSKDELSKELDGRIHMDFPEWPGREDADIDHWCFT